MVDGFPKYHLAIRSCSFYRACCRELPRISRLYPIIPRDSRYPATLCCRFFNVSESHNLPTPTGRRVGLFDDRGAEEPLHGFVLRGPSHDLVGTGPGR